MGDDSMVQIHVRRADDLGRFLTEAADGYDGMVPTVRHFLDVARVPATAAGQLGSIAYRLRDEARKVQGVVAEVRSMESGLAPKTYDVDISHGLYHSPFATDADAAAAAQAAWDAYRRGDLTEFVRLNELWSTEGAYAAPFAAQVTPNDVLDALARYEEAHHQVAISDWARTTTAAMVNFLQPLSVASRMGVPTPSFGQLADQLDAESHTDAPTKYKALAHLFEPDVEWSAPFLVDASKRFLLPANRDVLDHGDTGLYVNTDGTDARLLVLGAVAANREASAAVLGLDLDALLPSRLDYRDGGKALGEVLANGTVPDAPDGPRHALAVIDWVAVHEDLQPMAQAALGRVATPYIGSFRDARYRRHEVSVADPLPELSSEHAQAFLDYASVVNATHTDLRLAAGQWADRELELMAPRGYDDYNLQAIGNVYGNVSFARYRGKAEIAARSDEQIAENRRVGNWFVSVVSGFTPVPIGSIAVSIGGSELISAIRPDGVMSREYAEKGPAEVSDDAAYLDALVVGRLWQHRATNHAFDVVPAPPSELIGPGGRLKTVNELDSHGQEIMRRWLDDANSLSPAKLALPLRAFPLAKQST